VTAVSGWGISKVGRVESYNAKGEQVEEFDPNNDQQTKPAEPIVASIRKAKRAAMSVKWALRVYRGDELFMDSELSAFDSERVRSFLGRSKEEDTYGCYELSSRQVEQIGQLAGLDLTGLQLDAGDAGFLEDYTDD
jgi:hypothetical protein